MGPADAMPGLPELEWAVVPDDQRRVSKRLQNSCFTQAMEGGIEPTDYGLLIGARRNAPNGGYYWRLTQWLMPWYTFIPGGGSDHATGAHAWVPVDDEHCTAWSFTYHPDRPLNEREIAGVEGGLGIHQHTIPGSDIPVANASNDYFVDRRMQAHMLSLSGIRGVGTQDAAMQESMGPQFDPSTEQLGSADAAIIASRRRLLAESRALAANPGAVPTGTDPASQRVRSTSAVLTADESWIEATADARRAVSIHYSSL
jgi:hypothetical protein